MMQYYYPLYNDYVQTLTLNFQNDNYTKIIA